MPKNRREEEWINDLVFTISNFFSKEECQRLINYAEEIGFEEATVNTEKGAVRLTEVRNNDRIVIKDFALAQQIFDVADDFLPSEYLERNPIAANELLRFYRYEQGQQFDRHLDIPY